MESVHTDPFPSLHLVGKGQRPAEKQKKLKSRERRTLSGCHPGGWRVGSLSEISWGPIMTRARVVSISWRWGRYARRENLVEAREHRLWFLL